MVLKITVKTLDSQNYQFEAEDEWTVKRFKEHIESTVNVPHTEQRLIFCGRVLQDDKKLTEYDCNGKVMHLVRRPPPSLENPDRDSAADNSDTNNNDSNFPGEIRFGEDDNVLFSAMTLGSVGHDLGAPNQMLRHIMTLQQELYSRIIGEPTNFVPAHSDSGDADIGRRLHNASRLSRIIDSLLNECTSRLSRNQVSRQARSRNSASTSASTSRGPNSDSLFEPTQVLSAARSHTELQTSDYLQTSETETTSANTATVESSSEDSAASRSSETGTGGSSYMARRQPRPALTTDDLPQDDSRLTRPFAPAIDPRPRNDNAPPAARQESPLDQYMTLLANSNDIIDRTRNLVSRYRELVTISRQGGFILPTQTQATPESQQRQQQSSNPNATASNGSNQGPISSALVQEARILNHYVPRILHHSSHLQHSLSDFSVDFARGRLRVVSNRQQQQHAHQPSASGSAPVGRVRIGTSRGQSSDRSQIEVPLDVTITATTIETQPMTTTTSSRPQASATIVVSTEPGQAGIHIPVSIPLAVNIRDVSASARTSHLNNEQRDSPRSPSPDVSNQSDQQQRPSQQTTRENTSTQTAPRPIGVISGRIPLPFDYFLSCFSPHAHYATPQTARSQNHPSTRVRAQASRPQESAPGATHRATHPNVQVRTGTIPLNTQPLDAAMTEVVNNIIGSIFRPPTSQPTTQASATTQSASGPTSAPNPAQDPIFNMIPELAINAASQVLGGLFGHVGAGPTAQQPQANTQQRTGQQQQQQQQQTPSAGHVMMDIDIDDSSSSQSGSRYQDARESVPRVETQASSSRQPPVMAQPTVSVSTPITYSREQLIDIARAHADWIPIIESDISFMEQQSRMVANSPPYFSDAYLSSVPRKRRRLLTATPDRVLILHPSPFHAIKNVLRRAVANSNLPTESQDQVLTSIANDPELQSAYDEYIKSAVEARLRTDYDYKPEKFENSSKYYK